VCYALSARAHPTSTSPPGLQFAAGVIGFLCEKAKDDADAQDLVQEIMNAVPLLEMVAYDQELNQAEMRRLGIPDSVTRTLVLVRSAYMQLWYMLVQRHETDRCADWFTKAFESTNFRDAMEGFKEDIVSFHQQLLIGMQLQRGAFLVAKLSNVESLVTELKISSGVCVCVSVCGCTSAPHAPRPILPDRGGRS
jgi:hypothetical protein